MSSWKEYNQDKIWTHLEIIVEEFATDRSAGAQVLSIIILGFNFPDLSVTVNNDQQRNIRKGKHYNQIMDGFYLISFCKVSIPD